MEESWSNLFIAVAPALIVGVLAYYFFDNFVKNEDGRRRFLLQKDHQADSLPVRLQAYERLTLFLERIKPGQLLVRIKPQQEQVSPYEQLLILTIEQEFEHNLSQQIYLSDELWNIIKSAKNGTIKLIRQNAIDERLKDASGLREQILKDMIERPAPSEVALEYLKKEVKEIIG